MVASNFVLTIGINMIFEIGSNGDILLGYPARSELPDIASLRINDSHKSSIFSSAVIQSV